MSRYSEEEIVKGCQKNKRRYQEALYNEFAPRLLPVCMRYARHTSEAEDILHLGFLKVFKYFHTYNASGSLYGWMKRVFINVAIKHYAQNKKHYDTLPDSAAYQIRDEGFSVIENLKQEDLLKIVNELPDGYRIVFNLYVLEGYKHREISEMLGITEGTSKSQLAKAKIMLRNRVGQLIDYQQESDKYAK